MTNLNELRAAAERYREWLARDDAARIANGGSVMEGMFALADYALRMLPRPISDISADYMEGGNLLLFSGRWHVGYWSDILGGWFDAEKECKCSPTYWCELPPGITKVD